MKNLESVDGLTDGPGEEEAVAGVESEGEGEDAMNEEDKVRKKSVDKAVVFEPKDIVCSEGENGNGHVSSEENDADDKGGEVDKTVDLVSSETDNGIVLPAANGKNEKNQVPSQNENGVDHTSDEEASVENLVDDDLPPVEPSSDFELSEIEREGSVPTEPLTPGGDNEDKESQNTSNDEPELMEVSESPESVEEGSIDPENEPIDDKEETASGEAETSRDKENTDDETKKSADCTEEEASAETTTEVESSKASNEGSESNETELSKETENGDSIGHDSDSNSKESSTENSRDSCKILFGSFVDQSPAKEKPEDSNEKDKASEPEAVNNTISLEPASTDDDSQSQESEEDLDINAGLEKCFSALENRIDKEEESSDEAENKKGEKEKDGESKEESSGIDIPIHDVDDDDEM